MSIDKKGRTQEWSTQRNEYKLQPIYYVKLTTWLKPFFLIETRRLFRGTTSIWRETTCSETTSNRWEEMPSSLPGWEKNEYPAEPSFIFRVFKASKSNREAGKERREARKK